MRLFVLGMRRSGTTVFWRTFRQDRRLVSYNEPFNPVLYRLPDDDIWGTADEYRTLLRRDPGDFWARLAPIAPEEELQSTLSDRQRAWLRHLLTTGEHVSMDITRCHFKLQALHEIAPDAVVVHLYRAAPCMTTSHMLPNAPGLRGRLRRRVRQWDFWTRTTRYDNWGVERIVGASRDGPFAGRLREIGLDPDEVLTMPAVGKVLAYWRVNFERIEAEGPRLLGDRFLSVELGEFCRAPAAVVDRIYRTAGLEAPAIDYSRVHPAKGAFRPASPRWAELGRRLGIDAARMSTGG